MKSQYLPQYPSQHAVQLSADVDCLLYSSPTEFGCVVAIDSFASAILGIVSDQDGFDVVPATGHIAVARPHTSPGTASVLQKSVVQLLLLMWVLVQEVREEAQQQKNHLIAPAVMAVVVCR